MRLVKLLRTFRDYGFTLANAQGSDPPSPRLLETITREHGVRYDDAALAERLERLETTAIKRYLVRAWSMTQADIDDMLGRCEAIPHSDRDSWPWHWSRRHDRINRLGRSYNRTAHLPQRKEMMQKWADYLDTLMGGAEIIQLRGCLTAAGWREQEHLFEIRR